MSRRALVGPGALVGAILLGSLFAGCGVDEIPSPLDRRRSGLTTERSFESGSVRVTEQITQTFSTIGTTYHLRAQALNLGSDLPAARYEMVVSRVVELTTGGIDIRDPRVVATQELGTLVSGATAVVALEHEELGGSRLQVLGRFASGS